MTYKVIQVPDTARQLEQLGTKEKFWFEDEHRQLHLFKVARDNTGEDWAEKISAELCEALGLPHADYELAEHEGRRGVLTPRFHPEGGRLVFGNELLSFVVAEYETAPRHRRVHHTLGRVLAMLEAGNVGPPLGWDVASGLVSGESVFVGYLMLDTLIGNQDRHDQNWGVLLLDGGVHLQPTYDHASSLGRLLSDEACALRLASKDANQSVAHYVTRARSALYPPSGTKTMLTLDAFEAAARRNPKAATYWLERLASLEDDVMTNIIDQVPDSRMGAASKDFAFQMLRLNKSRLLDKK
ncbi:hypothetical protein ACFWZ3_09650 [Frateuria sp. GZRR35]|uniref:hypothetical protein n=1 Tax=Frateuria sp. GZRR35 TaxID=3351536 RepID=UPI003EDC7413